MECPTNLWTLHLRLEVVKQELREHKGRHLLCWCRQLHVVLHLDHVDYICGALGTTNLHDHSILHLHKGDALHEVVTTHYYILGCEDYHAIDIGILCHELCGNEYVVHIGDILYQYVVALTAHAREVVNEHRKMYLAVLLKLACHDDTEPHV